jgi:hypothetical protein
LLSLPAGTEMFHFPALPSPALCIQAGTTPHDGCRVSPFGNPRINARLPAPRGLSQAPTSFIGSWYQDIHRVPLKTWLSLQMQKRTFTKKVLRCSRSLCSSQDTDGTTHRGLPSGRPRQRAVRVGWPQAKRLLPQDPTACWELSPPMTLVPRLPEGSAYWPGYGRKAIRIASAPLESMDAHPGIRRVKAPGAP